MRIRQPIALLLSLLINLSAPALAEPNKQPYAGIQYKSLQLAVTISEFKEQCAKQQWFCTEYPHNRDEDLVYGDNRKFIIQTGPSGLLAGQAAYNPVCTFLPDEQGEYRLATIIGSINDWNLKAVASSAASEYGEPTYKEDTHSIMWTRGQSPIQAHSRLIPGSWTRLMIQPDDNPGRITVTFSDINLVLLAAFRQRQKMESADSAPVPKL